MMESPKKKRVMIVRSQQELPDVDSSQTYSDSSDLMIEKVKKRRNLRKAQFSKSKTLGQDFDHRGGSTRSWLSKAQKKKLR